MMENINMNNETNLSTLIFEPLTEKNLKQVYQLCEKNVLFVSQPFYIFQRVTLDSASFEPDFSIVARDFEGNVFGFFMVVFRRTYIFREKRKVAVLKFFVVDKSWRYKGLGTAIYNILLERIKQSEKKCFKMKFEVLSAMPDYWLPGLDPRHTEAYFFLKKQGFKKAEERLNLCVDLNTISEKKPKDEIKGYKISRATLDDKEALAPLKFMPRIYRLSFWPDEIKLSVQNDPITTFVAKEPNTGKIVGWASHSVHFPGDFGPTGVRPSLQGKGIGGLLLAWCLWDIKQMGLKEARIMWVEKDTVYFYLKSSGARICVFYWAMKKRI